MTEFTSARLAELRAVAEAWRPVVGWEDAYEVSDMGRVRSIDRKLPDGRFWRGKLMRQSGDRYLQVTLNHGGRSRRVSAHRMVAEAFLGASRPGPFVCHINGNSRDNRARNLKWGTHEENMSDRENHGTIARGERNGGAKLTVGQVEEIRASVEAGESQRSVARRYDVSQSTVWRAVRTHWRSRAEEGDDR